ncbi:hypothetical protein [Flavobacterium sp. ASV13]|uniref:hypothetical protein n=1 Tax=Flavobacterium sp. ASV13 TaxID=1506583 RepID=UPI000553FDF2|nr:hypothetical protein [Flavobacterium sp. ASV13]
MENNIQLDNLNDKKKLLKTTKKLIKKISLEIPMLRKSITGVHNVEMATEISYHFSSVPLLLRLSILDVCVLFKLYLESNSETEQNLLLRLLCGQLYEFVEDVPELFGKKYRLLLSQFPNAEEITKALNYDIIKELNMIKSRHSEFLKLIRHNVAHHKDTDALWQYYLINEIDFNWAVKAYIDIVKWYMVSFSEFELKLIEIAMSNQKD